MNKYLVMVLIAIGLVSCSAKNESYYRSHPEELQNALKACPAQQPSGVSCRQLQQLGDRLNHLAYQLQSNPQGFGAKILSLQQTIAQQELELKEKKTDVNLSRSLGQNRHDLVDYMAVVKWLESPE